MMDQEKLRELCQAAGFDVAALVKPLPGGFPSENMLALESLVVLAVEECLLVLDTINYKSSDEWCSALNTAEADIKSHFGMP
jgi:hypothetical protein